jgi:hypothetical protein
VTAEKPDAPPFSRARTWGGLGMLALVVLLYVMDAVSLDFHVDSIQLGLLLGSALLLLGVEAGKRFIR